MNIYDIKRGFEKAAQSIKKAVSPVQTTLPEAPSSCEAPAAQPKLVEIEYLEPENAGLPDSPQTKFCDLAGHETPAMVGNDASVHASWPERATGRDETNGSSVMGGAQPPPDQQTMQRNLLPPGADANAAEVRQKMFPPSATTQERNANDAVQIAHAIGAAIMPALEQVLKASSRMEERLIAQHEVMVQQQQTTQQLFQSTMAVMATVASAMEKISESGVRRGEGSATNLTTPPPQVGAGDDKTAEATVHSLAPGTPPRSPR